MEISILTDGGRCCRPLYHMDNNQILMDDEMVDDLKNEKINWLNLVYGKSNKKDIMDYYNCEYNCPDNSN